MFYIYQQTAVYQDKYVQIATNENQEAAVDAARHARAMGGGCAVVTSTDNALGKSAISKPTAGVVFDSSAS